MTARTWRGWLVVVLGTWSLAGCGGPAPGPADAGFQGTWLVTPTAGDLEFFGSDGPVTLAFDGPAVGTAALRALRGASGVVVCGHLVFAADGNRFLLSSPRLFDAEFDLVRVDDDTVTLTNADVAATLTRLAGAGPVPACGEATATAVATLPFVADQFGNLSAVGGTLYLNVDDDPGTVVGYDVAAATLDGGRVLTTANDGGIHRWVVGARDASRFFGHCGCGGSTTLAAFDLDLDAVSIATDTTSAAAVPFSIRYGEFAAGAILFGGSAAGGGTNRLATADPDTLAIGAERSFLDDAFVVDVAVRDGELFALVALPSGPALVAVGADGRATATFPLPELDPFTAIGTAAIGDVLYVAVVDDDAGLTRLLAVEVP